MHPQIVFGVPRVCEKIYSGVNAALAADPETARRKFDEGVAAAIEIKRAERDGTATQEQLDTWAFLDAVAFCHGARRWSGSTRSQLAITRRGADPGGDPRVVRRDRRAAVARSTG